MRKPRKASLVKTVGGNLKRRATKSAIESVYVCMWGERPSKGRRAR